MRDDRQGRGSVFFEKKKINSRGPLLKRGILLAPCGRGGNQLTVERKRAITKYNRR